MPKPQDVPPCPAVPAAPQTGRVSCELKIQLITPLFGGGVEPRVNDLAFPIRPTAIRGQLQFWWRATVGAQYAALAELRRFHTDIWGSTKRASPVDVLVDRVEASKPTPCAHYEKDRSQTGKYRSTPSWNPPFNNTSLPYALFPFQGQLAKGRTAVEVDPAACIQQARFRLVIRCPTDLWPHVEPAVWAWVNFGGLGARTRRGCGAIKGRQIDADGATIKELAPRDRDELIEHCTRFLQSPSEPQDWPTLAETILVGGEQPNAIAAWDAVIQCFKHFRQGEKLGRNSGQQPNRPGRSRFPEPDTIRRVTRQWKGSHQPDDEKPNAFPRAELGLPIVFHFKDEDKKNLRNPKADPSETVLYPDAAANGEKRERMASPLILRPVALAHRSAVPVILQLKLPQLSGVDLRRGDTSLSLPSSTAIRGEGLATYPNSPLNLKQFAEHQEKDKVVETGSALDAFLAYALTQGFTEVTR